MDLKVAVATTKKKANTLQVQGVQSGPDTDPIITYSVRLREIIALAGPSSTGDSEGLMLNLGTTATIVDGGVKYAVNMRNPRGGAWVSLTVNASETKTEQAHTAANG